MMHARTHTGPGSIAEKDDETGTHAGEVAT